jgi:hypothetical protein
MFMGFRSAKRRAHSSPFSESTEKSIGTIKLVMAHVLVISANLTKTVEIY